MMTYQSADPGNDMADEDAATFRQGLIDSYGTREALADALADRISEARDLNAMIEQLREEAKDATLTARIRDLEAQLATVNARLCAAQGGIAQPAADMVLRMIVSKLKAGQIVPGKLIESAELALRVPGYGLRSEGHSERDSA